MNSSISFYAWHARIRAGLGYTRSQRSLDNPGHAIDRGNIANMWKVHGIDPAPLRGKTSSWNYFIKAHWDVLTATDFSTSELGRVAFLSPTTFFVIELATSSPPIAGAPPHSKNAFMIKSFHQLTGPMDGCLLGKRHLILDRKTNYTQALSTFLERESIKVIRLLPPHPLSILKLNVSFVKRRALPPNDIFRRSLTPWCHRRNDGSLSHGTKSSAHGQVQYTEGVVHCQERLGAMLCCYYRETA